MARESLKELGPTHLNWGAILGGSFFALGLMTLLGWLGLAIGLSIVGNAPQGAGVWMAVWAFLVPIIALFVGGMVAGRFGGVTNNRGGGVLGAVTWGFTTLLATLIGGLLLMSMLSGLMNLGGSVLGAAGQAVSNVSSIDAGQAGQALGIDAQDLLGPINENRQEQGLPPLQAENVRAAIQDAVSTSLQQGQINREILIDSLVQNTQVTRAEAERLATDIEGRVGQTGAEIQRTADQARGAMAGTVWLGFVSSLLTLLAAVAGGMAGVSGTQKRMLREPTTEPPPRTYVPGPGGEVYP